MITNITISLPHGMEIYAEDIKLFVDVMVHKLWKNQHKGRWETISVLKAHNLLQKEVEELWKEVTNGEAEQIYYEAADVANFALIIASITRERGGNAA